MLPMRFVVMRPLATVPSLWRRPRRLFDSGPACSLGRREKPRGIQNEGQFRRDMDECREQRTEKTEGGQPDPERIDDKRAGEVLPDDAAGATGHGEGFDKASEIVPEQHHIRALARNVSA